MKSGVNKSLLGILTFTPLIMALIALSYLPDTIPIHYDFRGVVNSFGSKYIILILPIIAMVYPGVYIIRERMGTATENKYAVMTSMVIFNVITFAILFVTFKAIEISNEISSIKIITIAIGVLFIIMGNYMPKVKRNGAFGIRTPWTMGNDEVWYKTHRLGGKLTILFGVIIIILPLIFKEITVIPMLVVVILNALILTGYSYMVAKE